MELNDKIVIYRSEDGETQLEVRIDQDTVWLNAYQIAELFGRDSKTIRKQNWQAKWCDRWQKPDT